MRHGRLDAPLALDDGGTLRVEPEPHRPRGAAGRLPAGRQRLPHPRRGLQPGRRGARRHRRQQGPADAGQGVGVRPDRRGVPRRAWPSTPAGRA
nr:hypothetical protein [Angustibacter aerolatus]